MRKGPRRWIFEINWGIRLLWWKLKCRINDIISGPRYSEDPQVILARAMTEANFRASVELARMYLFATPEERTAEIRRSSEEFNKALAEYREEFQKFTSTLRQNKDANDLGDTVN